MAKTTTIVTAIRDQGLKILVMTRPQAQTPGTRARLRGDLWVMELRPRRVLQTNGVPPGPTAKKTRAGDDDG